VTKSIIEFVDCTIGYETPLLNHLNLQIHSGDFISIVGRTGIGKSTLLRLIGNVDTHLRKPNIISGALIMKNDFEAGIVFQSLDQLFPWKTAIENVMLAYHAGRVQSDKQTAYENAKKLLVEVGLEDQSNTYPNILSGGMRQRVAIARSMLGEPDILLMDEPFGSLDPHTRRKLQETLRDLHKKHGMTVVFITHDINEAIILSSRVLAIKNNEEYQVFHSSDLKEYESLEHEILDYLAE